MQLVSKFIFLCMSQFFSFGMIYAQTSDGFIITNRSLTITMDDAIDIFKGQKQLVGSVKVAPVDNTSAQNNFLSKVLGISVAQYNVLWSKASFGDGLSKPGVKNTDAEIIEAVKSTPGGVGYVTTKPGDDVKVVGKFSENE